MESSDDHTWGNQYLRKPVSGEMVGHFGAETLRRELFPKRQAIFCCAVEGFSAPDSYGSRAPSPDPFLFLLVRWRATRSIFFTGLELPQGFPNYSLSENCLKFQQADASYSGNKPNIALQDSSLGEDITGVIRRKLRLALEMLIWQKLCLYSKNFVSHARVLKYTIEVIEVKIGTEW